MKREKTPWSGLTQTVILKVSSLLTQEMKKILEKVAKSLVPPWASRKFLYNLNYFIYRRANKSANVSVGAAGKSVSQEDEDVEGEEEDSVSTSRVSGGASGASANVYDIINKALNKDKYSIAWPKGWKNRLIYIFKMPLTHTQAITIPFPSKGHESYYPLTLLMAIVWIWLFSYLICWFTYSVTKAFNLHFSIIPMFIYPFGISLRDIKKFTDFKLAMAQFKEDIPDQEVSLAEAFQG